MVEPSLEGFELFNCQGDLTQGNFNSKHPRFVGTLT